MASDGKIIIETSLDTKSFEKDVESATGKVATGLGKGTEKAMKQAENSIKSVGKAVNSIDFSKVSKQMDSISKNIEKTSTKLDKQKEKLDKLKKSYESATDVKDQNKIASQMQKAEASVTKLESKLNGLKDKQVNLKVKMDSMNGLDGTFRSASMSIAKDLDNIKNKADEAGKSVKKSLENINVGENISKIGSSISGVGDKLTTRVTLPIVGLGAVAAKIGMDFDSGMSRVKAISGATGEEFKQLHDQALQLGADTAFSAKQAAEGMENLAAAGFSTEETMAAMPGLLDLAASSGESLASSSDIAASTLRGFGLEASQAGHVADVLAKNANATNAAVSDTGEAMKYISPVAHAMGLSFEEITAAIGEMANSGIKGSQAGTTLRSALTRLASPSKEAAGLMKQLGFSAFDSQGKLKPLSTVVQELNDKTAKLTDQKKEDAIATIFGQESMSGMMVLMQGGKQALDDLTESYKNSDGAAKEMAETMQDNAGSSIEQMMGSIETAAIKLEEVAAPTIRKIADEIQDYANRFSELSPEMQEFIIKAALGAAALGPIAKVLGTVTGGIGKLIKLGGSLAKTIGLVGTAAETTTAVGTAAEAGSVALGGFSLAAGVAVGAAAALTIGIAGVVTHNELMKKSMDTSTEDLNAWERAVNSVTGNTIKSKSELQKLGLVYKDFGEGVSDSFKEGVQKTRDEFHNLELLINQTNVGDTLTEANKGKISSAINKMIDEAKTAVNSRKDELQKDITAGMTADDGVVSENEQKVLDIIGKQSDAKLSKIDEYKKSITNIWNKAIEEHGKLGDEDVRQIQNSLKMIEQIKMEAAAKNNAESTFTENNFVEQLNGISSEDAKKLYTDTSKTIHDNYAKLKATYKTENDDLNKALKEAQKSGTEEEVKAIQQEIEAKNKAYDEATEEERGKRRKLLDMLYEKNPSLKNNFNEITGEMFSKQDKDSQGRLSNLKAKYDEIATATKSGIKHVYDATTGWHDVYVTVDEATGNITSAFDVNAREGETAIGGYSAKFEQSTKEAAEKAKKDMQNLYEAFELNQGQIDKGAIKLQGDSLINIDTGATLSKFDTIIEKANGLKVAIANINGKQVKIEFDQKGVITNVKDVKAAIDGLAESPAKIGIDVDSKDAVDKFKKLEDLKDQLNKNGGLGHSVKIDDQEFTKVEDVINKVENWPRDKDLKINIDGEEVSTIDGVLDKLSKVPKETKTKITIDGTEVSTADEAIKKLEELKETDPNAKIVINGEEIPTIDEAIEKLKNVPEDTNTEIKVDSDNADSKLDSTKNKIDNVPSEKQVNIVVNYLTGATEGLGANSGIGGAAASLDITKHYTGTGGGSEGLTTMNEHGGFPEITTGEQELYYLGSGTGILDSGSSKNYVDGAIRNQVNNGFGKVINPLLNGISSQNSKLNAIADNTAQTVKVNQQGNKLNEHLANNMVNTWKTTTGTNNFSKLQKEITDANNKKATADNAKPESKSYYMDAKQNLDDINAQLDELKEKQQEISDNQSADAGKGEKKWNEAAKKEIEAQQHALEKKKELAEKEVNVAKEAAQNEIEAAKNAAEQEVKIAEAKKEKLTRLSEAVTTAIKNQYEKEKKAAEDHINKDLKTMEDRYNKQVKELEDRYKRKSDSIDAKIKALEEESTENSREDERKEANNNIYALQVKIANTADEADKRKFQLELEKAKKELNKKEDSWNIEDQKAELETEKDKLSKREEDEKESLEKRYNKQKEAKEKELKDTDKYYDKLLEEDNINARARYLLMNNNQQEILQLLQSYNPLWQDAGQSLADSLLNGLNSQKQSIKDAISDVMSFGGAPPQITYNGDTRQYVKGGYASGTNFNPVAGHYLTNEDGPEMSTEGDVAYVSKGAAIKNRMQTEQFIKNEIASQVAMMRNTVMSEQANMKALLAGNLAGSTSNTTIKNEHNQNAPLFQAENVYFKEEEDMEQMAYKLGFYATKNKVN